MSKDYLSKSKMAEQLRWLEERQTIHSDEVENKQLRIELAKVKKQLAIAVEALEIYADKTNWDNHFTIEINNCEIEVITFIEGTDKDGEFYAEKALQQIKELNK